MPTLSLQPQASSLSTSLKPSHAKDEQNMNPTQTISQSAQTTQMRDLLLVATNGPKKCTRRAGRFTKCAQVLEARDGHTPCFSRRLRARRATGCTCVVNRVFIAEQIRKNLLDKGTVTVTVAVGGQSRRVGIPLSPPPHRPTVPPSRRPIGGWKPPLRLQSFTSP